MENHSFAFCLLPSLCGKWKWAPLNRKSKGGGETPFSSTSSILPFSLLLSRITKVVCGICPRQGKIKVKKYSLFPRKNCLVFLFGLNLNLNFFSISDIGESIVCGASWLKGKGGKDRGSHLRAMQRGKENFTFRQRTHPHFAYFLSEFPPLDLGIISPLSKM